MQDSQNKAINQATKDLIDKLLLERLSLAIEDRSEAGTKALWQSLPPLYRQCAVCYTDFWAAYAAVLPSQRHQAAGKESGLTSRIERFNCTLRQ